MSRMELPILYQDEQLVAVHKPAGLLVHRSPIDRHETRFAVQLLRDQLGQRVYPVHRLDKPTSGVMLFGLSPEAARAMAIRFVDGAVRKTYLAVVRGVPEQQGVIDHPLLEEPDRLDYSISQERGAQPAVTEFRRLASVELPFAVGRYASSRYALLELHPRNGRRHQLRRHCKHIFHPIIGDSKYGEGRHNRFFREQLGCHRLLLAATEICLPHPASGAELRISAPPEASFAAVLVQLGWDQLWPVNAPSRSPKALPGILNSSGLLFS
jgi:tRNA pseudouridine65 synthase